MDITIKLTKPITDMGEEISELTFREPVFGDLLSVPDINNEMQVVATIIEKCANISAPAVKQISLKDIKPISEKLQPFLDL